MFTKKFISIVVIVLAVSSIVSAGYYIDSGDHLWNNPSNWIYDSGIPTAGSYNQLVGWNGQPEVCNITTGVNAVSMGLYIGQSTAGLTTTLNITGTGTLNVGGGMSIAQYDDATTGTVNVKDSASIIVGGALAVGEGGTGTLHMTGGTVRATEIYVTMWNAGSVGHIQLDGGLLQGVNNFWMGIAGMESSMDINGGTLKVPYSLGSTIEGYIAAGKITAKGLNGLNNFSEATDGATYWTFQAIPEPITMSMLALGGLFIRRKK